MKHLLRRLLGGLLLAVVALPAAAACPRIVSQSPYITRALDWLGLERCIVGVSRYPDGPLFTHPGPDLLKGLEQLRETLQEIKP